MGRMFHFVEVDQLLRDRSVLAVLLPAPVWFGRCLLVGSHVLREVAVCRKAFGTFGTLEGFTFSVGPFVSLQQGWVPKNLGTETAGIVSDNILSMFVHVFNVGL